MKWANYSDNISCQINNKKFYISFKDPGTPFLTLTEWTLEKNHLSQRYSLTFRYWPWGCCYKAFATYSLFRVLSNDPTAFFIPFFHTKRWAVYLFQWLDIEDWFWTQILSINIAFKNDVEPLLRMKKLDLAFSSNRICSIRVWGRLLLLLFSGKITRILDTYLANKFCFCLHNFLNRTCRYFKICIKVVIHFSP